MNYTYSNDINNFYLHITDQSSDSEINDFRVKMLLHNRLDGFIPLNITYTDNLPEYTYNITGLTSLTNICGKEKITLSSFLSLMNSLSSVLYLSDKYLLNTDNFVFSSDFIYVNPDSFNISICYCPLYRASFKESFYDLVCFLLNYIDYDDSTLVEKVYNLQKECIKSELPVKLILDRFTENSSSDDICISQYAQEVPESTEGATSFTALKPCKINKFLINDVDKKKLHLRQLLPFIKLSAGSIFVYILLIFLQIKFDLLSSVMLIILIPVLLIIIGYSIYKILKLKEKYYDSPLISSLMSKNHENSKKLCDKNDDTPEITEEPVEPDKPEAPEILYSESENLSKLIPEDKVHYDTIKLTTYPFTVGKISGNTDGYIFSPLVSRVHARISFDDDKFFLQDLNSANGTYLNGEKLQSETVYPLYSGDIISFSTIKYTFLCI